MPVSLNRPTRLVPALSFVYFAIGLALTGSPVNAQTLDTLSVLVPGEFHRTSIAGRVLDESSSPLSYASVVLYAASDTSVVKVAITDDDGTYAISGFTPGAYFVGVEYVGLPDARTEAFDVESGQRRTQPPITFSARSEELAEATVTAERRIVEVKTDRTVFNVQGTINATGGDGLSLLRKAPGVVVDNGGELVVMGRSGVLVYVDGKRSPLAGEALAAFLQALPAEQIDRIDIISNPGVKYEAEGNAGIIDIRLKKNESWGSNGSVSTTVSRGEFSRGNVSATVNHREGAFNTFATGGIGAGETFGTNAFDRVQAGFAIDDDIFELETWRSANLKLGTDLRISDRHAIGVQLSGNLDDRGVTSDTRTTFARAQAPNRTDSILTSRSPADRLQYNLAGNLNYGFDDGAGQSLTADLDYGTFRREASERLPSTYLAPDGQTVLSRVDLAFETPYEIDLFTSTLDYARPLHGGRFGAGVKYTKIVSDNAFEFYELLGVESRMDGTRSNEFRYNEAVAAAYVSYVRDFGAEAPSGRGRAFTLSTGLRAEHTDTRGDLTVLDGSADTNVVDRDYLNFFPEVGLTWAAAEKHTFALSYGRRIRRPNYANLNPFLEFSSLVIFKQGNPRLRPALVNSAELTHTFASRYTTKLSLSRTEGQITQLTRRAEFDARAQYLRWENLNDQTVLALNVSIPATVAPWWETYLSMTGNYTHNVADFADGSSIDLSAYGLNIFNQNTFRLGGGWKAEVSGWFADPGLWGSFELRPMGALTLGAQKALLNDKLRLRVAVDDIFFTSPWEGLSDFGGTRFVGGGTEDSRRASLSLTYNFGNDKVKVEQRATGLRDAARRAE